MPKIAFLFPGQGSQFLGMGHDLFTHYSSVREIFDAADETAKNNISKLCFKGPLESLTQTIYLQPAITAVNLAFLSLIEKEGIVCDITAGHSLGEYSALKAAKVLSLSDVMKSVFIRGSLMDRESSKSNGIMCAIIGLEFDMVNSIIKKYQDIGIVSIANHNSKYQVVISGDVEPVNKIASSMSRLKSVRVLPLKVSGAWHSKLMKGMKTEFSNFLSTIQLQKPKCKIIHNVNFDIAKVDKIKNLLVEQICNTVLWYDSTCKLIDENIDVFVEIGPGKVLTNLLKKALPSDHDYKIFNTNDIRSLDKFLNYIV